MTSPKIATPVTVSPERTSFLEVWAIRDANNKVIAWCPTEEGANGLRDVCNAHDENEARIAYLEDVIRITRENLVRLGSMLPEEREKMFGPFWADMNNTLRAALEKVKQ